MNDHYYAVIMAGGGGTRLWPVSRKARPKHALALIGTRSLFQIAVDRIKPIIPSVNIYIVTVAEQAAMLQQLVPEIPKENYLIEPEPRGTAAVVGLAAVHLYKRDPEAVMACLTADHIMQNEEHLRDLLLAAYEAAQSSCLVTLGIAPDFPATGYGYIHRGEEAGTFGGKAAYHVLSFVEKPDRSTAEAYLAEGSYLWNSGMFIWRAERILQEMLLSMPALHSQLLSIMDTIGTPAYGSMLEKQWKLIVPQTIDYGVMEKADQVLVLPASDLGWLDMGSWDRFPEIMQADKNNNVVKSELSIIEESNNIIVFQEKRDGEKPRLISLLGVQDLIIVDTDDALMICSTKKADEVRKLVKILKERNLDRYL